MFQVPVIPDKEWRTHAHRRKGCYLSGCLLTPPRGWHVTQRDLDVWCLDPWMLGKDGFKALDVGSPISGWHVESYTLAGNEPFPPEFRHAGVLPPYRSRNNFCIDMMVFLERGRPKVSKDPRRDMVPFPEPHAWYFPLPVRYVKWVFMSPDEFMRQMSVELVPLLDEPDPLQ